MNPDDMEQGEFIQKLEDAIQQASKKMESAIRQNDNVKFTMASEAWRQAQLLWLQTAQNMSPEKAQATLVSFAIAGDLDKWVEENRPGPPPTILSLYKP